MSAASVPADKRKGKRSRNVRSVGASGQKKREKKQKCPQRRCQRTKSKETEVEMSAALMAADKIEVN
ncbi:MULTISPECIES: hypothetical protein [Bacillaceae]|uniref:Uncharacterized protein n=1 Tax=Evansella alkalicola TaxID=745819 RepID=A0ABS6JWL4_9BACI|nr:MULTISPECIES: hypothetical protein [Bacillaceae]MBU9722979.1 hypothetical protein [Bacillus alkalicola]